MSAFWNILKTFKISKCYTVISKCWSIFILIHFNSMITKHWKIWCNFRGGWVGFFCFSTNKYFQNIVILCTQIVKFSWKKCDMLRADEDGRMVFFHNEFLLHILQCKWNREIKHLLTKISNFLQINRMNTCCNVRLNIMIKRYKNIGWLIF